MAMPQISSLSAIPIHAESSSDVGSAIQLLPKLFNINHLAMAEENTDNFGDSKSNDSDDNRSRITTLGNGNHPSHEFIRIVRDMEEQLKERLKDASDGAIELQSRNDENTESLHNNYCHSSAAEMHEEFLLRCDAIMLELTAAVQQQLRREEKLHRLSGRKRKLTGGLQTASYATSNHDMSSTSASISPPLAYYSALVRQLQFISSLPNVTDVSLHKQFAAIDNTNTAANHEGLPADLTSVSITCIDANVRSHTWHAELYPSIVLTMDLPSEFVHDDKHIRLEKWWEDCRATGKASLGGETSAAATNGVLSRIHSRFESDLQKYQLLFDELDDLDSHLWILEPNLPARRCSVERRIALWEGGASMVLALDPDNPRGAPVMVRFLGVTLATMKAAANAQARADSGVGAVRTDRSGDIVDWRTSFAEFVSVDDDRNFQSGMNVLAKKQFWSEKRSVRENLGLWFGSPLPSPLSPSNEISDFLVECGICYTHRLPTEDSISSGNNEDGPLPEAKCCNPSCNRHYHESCLFEWLHSLPTARVSFDRIFGSCMYCCEPVSVKILTGSHAH